MPTLMLYLREDHTDNMDMSEDPSNNVIPLDVEPEGEKYQDVDEALAMKEDLDEVQDEPLAEKSWKKSRMYFLWGFQSVVLSVELTWLFLPS